MCPQCKVRSTFPVRQTYCCKKCAALASRKPTLDRDDAGRPTIGEQVKAALKKMKYRATLSQLADTLDVGPSRVAAAVKELQEGGLIFNLTGDKVLWNDAPEPGGAISMRLYEEGGWRKFGACGDQHYGSKTERPDVVEALYDLYAREKVEAVFNTGNWIEGEAGRMNYADVKVFGLDDQIEYVAKRYPQRPGIITYFIAGDDHEGWYQKKNRICIGAHFERKAREMGRTDLVYLGYMEAIIKLPTAHGEAYMSVMHPGGGSAYAVSYAPQKIAEAFQEGEKPHICLLGHYHKMNYGYHRGIHMVQTGCGQDQSSFMRKQKIKADVGGVIVEFHQSPYGEINRFKTEFFNFYDRDFYANKRRFDAGSRPTPTLTFDRGKKPKVA